MTQLRADPAEPLAESSLEPAGPGDRARPVAGQRLAPLRRGWRVLTSMRTALQLLFLLALAAIPGSFLPQRGIDPLRVRRYFVVHPHLAPWLDRFSLFDVFGSPWFAAVYLLLFVSLVGCVLPRTGWYLRVLRAGPVPAPAQLSRLPAHRELTTSATPAEVLDQVRTALRGRWRLAVVADGELAAEKGQLHEVGNLLFHASLVLLLAGVAIGGLFGFKGTVLVREGTGFANTVFEFDDVHPGRLFRADQLVPLHFTLDRFAATYGPDGHAHTFDAYVHWAAGPDAPARAADIRVNQPLHVGGAKVYLLGHGYAPHVVVRDRSGAVALDRAVPCLPQDSNFVSSCVVKVPDALPVQLAFEGQFTPDTAQDPVTGRVTSLSPAATAPGLTLVGWQGDLGLDSGVPTSVYELDHHGLKPVDQLAHQLQPGETWKLPGGGSITFAGVSQWATFQVTQDPGKGLALAAGIVAILGLVLSLRVRRRRVWVRARAAGPGRTVVEVGGLTRSGSDELVVEVAALTEKLQARLPPERGE